MASIAKELEEKKKKEEEKEQVPKLFLIFWTLYGVWKSNQNLRVLCAKLCAQISGIDVSQKLSHTKTFQLLSSDIPVIFKRKCLESWMKEIEIIYEARRFFTLNFIYFFLILLKTYRLDLLVKSMKGKRHFPLFKSVKGKMLCNFRQKI